MRHSILEVLLGGLVLVATVVLAISFYNANRDTAQKNYHLQAHFSKADGITAGAEVRLSGVKIGSVTDISLNQQNFLSVVKLKLDQQIKLPQNATASIASEGLLGKAFIRIEIPNAQNQPPFLADGDRITKTKDAVSIEDLLGRAIFLIGNIKE